MQIAAVRRVEVCLLFRVRPVLRSLTSPANSARPVTLTATSVSNNTVSASATITLTAVPVNLGAGRNRPHMRLKHRWEPLGPFKRLCWFGYVGRDARAILRSYFPYFFSIRCVLVLLKLGQRLPSE